MNINPAHFDGIQPGSRFLFISREERELLIINAEYPAGITNPIGMCTWELRATHRDFNNLCEKYSNQDAWKIAHALEYSIEYAFDEAYRGEISEYIPPEFRTHLFITNSSEAAAIGAQKDRIIGKWYIQNKHTKHDEICNQYLCNQSIVVWRAAERERLEKPSRQHKNLKVLIDDNFGNSRARIVPKPGAKPGQKQDAHKTFEMFKSRVEKGLITPSTKIADAVNMIVQAWAQLGMPVSASAVRKHIGNDYQKVIKKIGR